MERHKENQLVMRLSKLVQQNKALGNELKALQAKYDSLLVKQEEYEAIVERFSEFKEVKEILSEERQQTTKFNIVTVLFADIHGFSNIIPIAENGDLIDQLDEMYLQFDSIISRYPIEKIKTIGDSYMATGGIPEKNSTNPIEVVSGSF